MEIRKWLIIFVITAISGKFFAAVLNKMHLLPDEPIATTIERVAADKIKKIFFNDSVAQTPKAITPQNIFPKTSEKSMVATAKPILFGTPEKKAELVKTKLIEEEKARRKKRKKKLEEAADKDKKKKTPTLTVQKIGDDKKKSVLKNSDVSSYSYIAEIKNEDIEADTLGKQKVDLRKWSSLLLSQPTTQQLKSFLALYKAGQITAAEYYGVLSSLQKSENKEARKIAILGSSTEAHSLAFQILVHEKYSTTETEVELQTLAQQRIQVYKDAKYLGLLMDPMSHGDLFAKIESSDIVGQIAQSYQSSSAVLTADARNMFNRYVSILTRLSLDSSEILKTKANQSLILVKQVLGMTA